MKAQDLQKWYTRIIGVYFVSIILSLGFDLINFGYRPESWHKIFHISVGVVALYYGWGNQKFWKPFALTNGAFFTFVALFGLAFANFGVAEGFDGFRLNDTILHGLVGLGGLIVGLLDGFPKRKL